MLFKRKGKKMNVASNLRSGRGAVKILANACSCSLTDLPEGSFIFANSLLHLKAVGVEQAIVGPIGTVKAAVGATEVSCRIFPCSSILLLMKASAMGTSSRH